MTIITDSDLHDSLCQICIESPHSLLSELGYAAKQKTRKSKHRFTRFAARLTTVSRQILCSFQTVSFSAFAIQPTTRIGFHPFNCRLGFRTAFAKGGQINFHLWLRSGGAHNGLEAVPRLIAEHVACGQPV